MKETKFNCTPDILPSQKVWTIVGQRPMQLRVIYVEIKIRSTLTEKFIPEVTLTYTLENGVSRDGNEVFSTIDDLCSAIKAAV